MGANFVIQNCQSSFAEKIKIPEVFILEELIFKTPSLLLSYSKPNEYFKGIVYWAGKKTEDGILITTAFLPKAIVTPISFRVNSFDNAVLVSKMNSLGLELIAQVHSHPFGFKLTHCLAEEEAGFIPYDGLFSIIVPNYGLDGLLPLSKNGIYIFSNGKFVKLSEKQILSSFKIMPSIVNGSVL